MPERICPPWIGHILANPLRKLAQNPAAILGPHVREGMTVLEPGPGMGFFTLELAGMVGESGTVVAVDVQQKMLTGLARRAEKKNLGGRITTRLAQHDSLGVADLAGRVDFALAFAMIHELPDRKKFLGEVFAALRPGGRLLIAEPRGHVTAEAMNATLAEAAGYGFREISRPAIRWSHTALLEKP